MDVVGEERIDQWIEEPGDAAAAGDDERAERVGEGEPANRVFLYDEGLGHQIGRVLLGYLSHADRTLPIEVDDAYLAALATEVRSLELTFAEPRRIFVNDRVPVSLDRVFVPLEGEMSGGEGGRDFLTLFVGSGSYAKNPFVVRTGRRRLLSVLDVLDVLEGH